MVKIPQLLLLSLLTATSYSSIAASLINNDNPTEVTFSKAYKLYKTAIENEATESKLGSSAQELASLSAKKFGETHSNTINLTVSSANHYRNAKEYKIAATLYDEALSLYKQSDKENSQEYLLLLREILKTPQITTYKNQQELTKDLYSSLKSYFESTNADETILVSLMSYKTIALDGSMNRSNRKIVKLGDKILKAAQQRLPDNDARLIEAQFTHAKLLKAFGKKNDAIDYFVKVIDTTEVQHDYTPPYALGAHAQLVGLYEAKNDSESATEHCIAIGKMKPWDDNIEPIPLFRINPEYPIAAARKRKEGWAEMTFDISAFGFVENIKVTQVEGGEQFGESSITALERWRYAPKFENGMAVVAKDQKVRLDFSMGPTINEKPGLKNT